MEAGFDFISYFESVSESEQKKIIERARAQGGKFALLARILEGDESAAIELEEHIKARRVTPERDLIIRAN